MKCEVSPFLGLAINIKHVTYSNVVYKNRNLFTAISMVTVYLYKFWEDFSLQIIDFRQNPIVE